MSSDINTNYSLSWIIVLLLINLGLIGNLIHLNQKLWFIELNVLLIILTFLGGLLLLYQHGVGNNMVGNFRPIRPEVVVRYRNTLL